MSILTQRDILDVAEKNVYLRRWSFWLPWGWSIKLHKIMRPDSDRCLHGHPWAMIRIILYGGYIEERNNKKVTLKPWRPWAFWRVYLATGSFKHRINRLLKECSWTLVICSPAYQEWGFYTKQGFMHWREFLKEAKTARVMWCEDGRELKNED